MSGPTRKLTINGETRYIREWAELAGLTPSCLQGRLYRGWPLAQALAVETSAHDQLFPEREWLRRNVEMCRKSPNPLAYLRGVEIARGEDMADALRRACEASQGSV